MDSEKSYSFSIEIKLDKVTAPILKKGLQSALEALDFPEENSSKVANLLVDTLYESQDPTGEGTSTGIQMQMSQRDIVVFLESSNGDSLNHVCEKMESSALWEELGLECSYQFKEQKHSLLIDLR